MNVIPRTTTPLRSTSPSPRTVTASRARRRTAAALLPLAVLLAGCGGTAGSSSAPSGQPSSATAPSASAGLTMSDTYVKSAVKEGDMAMSAIFGTLSNSTDRDITVVRGTSDAAASVELHEMTMQDGAMKMRPREGGFVVPAGAALTLDPGGLHVMLIGLTRDIRAGDTVKATLTTSDGQDMTLTAVGRDLANANESYAPEAQ